MEMLVSVIIPVYNAQRWLDGCVKSLVGQTYEHLEIWLIDDGSTDSSGAICDRWAETDSRVHVIHQANAGAGMARNRGLDAARGQYVLFVDSDDYIAPETVAKCAARLRETGAGAVLFGRCEVEPDGRVCRKPIPAGQTFFGREQVRNDLLPGLFTYDLGFGVGVGGKMFDLSVIQRHGIRFPSERDVLSEDGCFMLALFGRLSSVAILPESLYCYRKNDQSLSRSIRTDHQKRSNAFLQKALALCADAGYPARTADHIRARYHTLALVGLKQIEGASIPEDQKRAALRAVFADEVLHRSITPAVLALDIPPARLFWRVFRRRWFWLCRVMLRWKARKRGSGT